jgi:PAS domain S-box-containing protein
MPLGGDAIVRVLLVHGERAHHECVCGLLPAVDGYGVDWAPDQQRARLLVRERPYDVALVVDYTGPASAAMIRALDATGIPVVVLTAGSSVDDDVEALAAGASDCVTISDVTPSVMRRSLRYARERHRANQRLRECEELFRSTFDHSPVGAAWLDPDGRWIGVNMQLQRLLGRSGDELLGSPIEALRHPDEPPFYETGMLQQRPVGQRWVAERRLQVRGGSYLWTQIAVAPRVGTPGFIAVIEDISARKRAQDELAMTLELSPDMLAVAKDGHLIHVNRAFTTVLGHSPDVLLSTPLIDFVHPDDRADTVAEIERVIRGAATDGFTNRWVTSTGEYKWLEWHARQDPVTGLRHAVGRDLTERHQLRQQLQQMQKIEAIGQLAGGVAHDFNNVLTSILGFSELAADAMPQDAPGRVELEEIAKAAGRAGALTRQLLAFARRQLLWPEPLDVGVVVQSMGAMLVRLIGEHVEFCVTPSSDLWVIEADKVQLEQVVLNLVVNARDAMPQGGQIIVETRNVRVDDAYCAAHRGVTPGEYVLLSITDTGTGMSDDVKARLFEPFFTTKPVGKGTGMGLPTVYGIVKQSGGFIWVYSEPGRGSTFKVYMPRSQRMLPDVQAAPAGAEALGGTETVLVVDDQDDIRKVATQVLRRNGYQVLTASCRDEVMAFVSDRTVHLDLLLVDVVLPLVTGPEIAAEAVQVRPDLHVLYMSGYTANTALRTGVLQEGMALLEKPFSGAALLQHVRKALDARASSRSPGAAAGLSSSDG